MSSPSLLLGAQGFKICAGNYQHLRGGCPGQAQARWERRCSLNGVWIWGGRCGMDGLGALVDPSVAAAGCCLPGEMFANQDTTFLHISVIRATLQTQLGRERQGVHGPQSCLQPPGLSPGTLGCPSAWHGSCPCFALHFWKILHGCDTGGRNLGCKFILQVEGCSLFWLLSLPHPYKS